MPAAAPFRTTVPVRWSDFDRSGHVADHIIQQYAGEAWTALARGPLADRGFPPATLRRIDIDYLRPVLADTRAVTVDTAITEVGSTSYQLHQTLMDQHGNIIAVVDSVMVVVGRDHSTAPELTTADRKALAAYAPEDADTDAGAACE